MYVRVDTGGERQITCKHVILKIVQYSFQEKAIVEYNMLISIG